LADWTSVNFAGVPDYLTLKVCKKNITIMSDVQSQHRRGLQRHHNYLSLGKR